MIINLFFDVVGYSDYFNSLDNNTFRENYNNSPGEVYYAANEINET